MHICPRPAARIVWERWPRFFDAYRRDLVVEALARRGPPYPPTLRWSLRSDAEDDLMPDAAADPPNDDVTNVLNRADVIVDPSGGDLVANRERAERQARFDGEDDARVGADFQAVGRLHAGLIGWWGYAVSGELVYDAAKVLAELGGGPW